MDEQKAYKDMSDSEKMLTGYDWLFDCISSCKLPFQLDGCHILLRLFKIKFENEAGYKDLYNKLEGALTTKDTLLNFK